MWKAMGFCHMQEIFITIWAVNTNKRLLIAKKVTDALKTASKKAIEKTVEWTGDTIGNRMANKVAETALQSTSSESTVPPHTDKTEKEVPITK